MARVNKDGTLDERNKSGKVRNRRRRWISFFVGLIAFIIFAGIYCDWDIEEVYTSPDGAGSLVLALLVGGLCNFILKKINNVRAHFED